MNTNRQLITQAYHLLSSTLPFSPLIQSLLLSYNLPSSAVLPRFSDLFFFSPVLSSLCISAILSSPKLSVSLLAFHLFSCQYSSPLLFSTLLQSPPLHSFFLIFSPLPSLLSTSLSFSSLLTPQLP